MVFTHIWPSDAPNSVLTEELFTVASSRLHIAEFRMGLFFICILVLSDSEWNRTVVYMQSLASPCAIVWYGRLTTIPKIGN